MSDSVPVSSPGHKHLVERKLSMEVFLDHVHPFGVSRLAIQLLEHILKINTQWDRALYSTQWAFWEPNPYHFHFSKIHSKRFCISLSWNPPTVSVAISKEFQVRHKRKWNRNISDLKLSLILLFLHLSSRQVEPRAASQRRRDSLLAAQPHLSHRNRVWQRSSTPQHVQSAVKAPDRHLVSVPLIEYTWTAYIRLEDREERQEKFAACRDKWRLEILILINWKWICVGYLFIELLDIAKERWM